MRRLAIALLLIAQVAWAATDERPMVPDERTAVRIAEAVMEGRCGECFSHNLPHVAKLKDGVWTVHGTLPEGWLGGTLEIKIEAATGRILDMYNTQ